MFRAILALAALSPTALLAAPIHAFFDDPGERFDPAVPPPEAVLRHELGEYHVTHDELIRYMELLAESSDRVRLERTGETHEGRPTFLLIITAAERMDQLEALREAHLADIAQGRDPAEDAPLFVWLGYSVHGNEASGANASLAVAYRLAASERREVRDILERTVVIMEPAINPDGIQRFASWVNANRSAHPSPDRADREHNETWPGGRTNHYWFDLNRDWLLLQHPESRARIAAFHRWHPQVLTDHHEMGSDNTFFFQPGVPDRRHPLTPERNVELTDAIADAHRAAFDQQGQLYYAQESFDDFYYGKGSTYPDANGAVGILFEQASARGHLTDSDNGRFSFADAIRNQVTASFSTLRGALANREALLAYQVDFYRERPTDGPAAYLFADTDRSGRGALLVDLLAQHGIEVEVLDGDATVAGTRVEAGRAWVVRTDQLQGRLVRAVMEERDEFPDHVFYDISTWTMPHAYGLVRAELDGGQLRRLATSVVDPATIQREGERELSREQTLDLRDGYAFLIDWRHHRAPGALELLHRAGIRTRVATTPLLVSSGSYPRGTLVVPVGGQEVEPAGLYEALSMVRSMGVPVVRVDTGATDGITDLGSPSVPPLTAPRVLLVTGPGVSSYEAGEVWHLLDRRHGIPVTRVEQARFGWMDLGDYTHIVLVNGGYGDLDAHSEDLGSWLREGGVIVAQKGAIAWLASAELVSLPEPEEGEEDGVGRRPYAERDDDFARDYIGGAILAVDVDLTHPLAYGYGRERMAVFRNHTRVLPLLDDAYGNVAVYTDEPHLSGYVSDDNLEALAGTVAIGTLRVGSGRVVLLNDDGQFRGFWRGTERFLMNALFLSSAID